MRDGGEKEEGRAEEKRRRRRLAKLCLRNDMGHKSFVISESGQREGTPDECLQVCVCVCVCERERERERE